MKNTILKFPSKETDIDLLNFDKVRDYHGKNIDIWSISRDLLSGMLDTYQMEDDDRLERVSLEIYGTPDYWDLLSLLNANDPLFDMPYNEGILRNAIDERVGIYQNYIYSNAPLIQSAADSMKLEYTDEVIQKNENLRMLTIVKPSRMNDFLTILKEKDFL